MAVRPSTFNMYRFSVKLRNEPEPHYFGTFNAAWYFVEQNRREVEEMFSERRANVRGQDVWMRLAVYQLENVVPTEDAAG
jgi:hypothetical protein